MLKESELTTKHKLRKLFSRCIIEPRILQVRVWIMSPYAAVARSVYKSIKLSLISIQLKWRPRINIIHLHRNEITFSVHKIMLRNFKRWIFLFKGYVVWPGCKRWQTNYKSVRIGQALTRETLNIPTGWEITIVVLIYTKNALTIYK